MPTNQSSCLSIIAREKERRSVFRPPQFMRSIPSQRKTLTATARPWYPFAQPEEKPFAPVPILTPPPALGETPELKPKHKEAPVLILTEGPPVSVNSLNSSLVSPFSPLSTPISPFFHIFSDGATATRVYPVDMFMSVRKDASHTPHGVLKWCVRQYLEVPSLKIPTHLQLSMNEIIRSEDGVTRGALGSGLTAKSRAKPVRQIHHKVMSILSRITPQKYTELLAELLQLPLRQTDDAELSEVVRVFFDKAIQEPEYSAMYSQLAQELCTMKENELGLEMELRDRLLCNRMRNQLITFCQEQFRRPIELSPDEKVDRTTGTPLGEEEVDMKRTRMKNRLVGNIKFVGELFKMNLVTDRVIEGILQLLLGTYDPEDPTAKDEYVFEVFSMLVKTVAEAFKDHKPYVLGHFLGVAKSVEYSHPKPRIRFLMMDLADLNKKHNWIPAKQLPNTKPPVKTTSQSGGVSAAKKQATPSITSPLSSMDVSREERVTSSGTANSQHYKLPQQRSGAVPATPGATVLEHSQSTGSYANWANGSTSNLYTPNSLNSGMGSANFFPKDGAITGGTPINGSRRLRLFKAAVPPPSITSGRTDQRYSPLNPTIGMEDATSAGVRGDDRGGRHTPTATGAHPGGTEMVNIQEVASQLMHSYNIPGEAPDVVRCIDGMCLKNKVLCLTWWLRQTATKTSLFNERQRVTNLLSDILTSCPSIRPTELQSAILEWVRFDIEKGEYIQCPRMFDNIANMILFSHSPEASALPNIQNVRELLHAGIFNVMLHELTTDKGTDQMVTLTRSAHNVSVHLLNSIVDPASPQDTLRVAVMNRFRLLPYFLSVSNGTDSEMPGTPPSRCRTPTTPNLRNSPLGDSITSTCHYDPLSQCLAFQRVAEDPEFLLFWKIRSDSAEGTWRDEAVKIALAPVGGNNSTVAQVVQVMKVVGALLACTTVTQRGNTLLCFADVDAVVAEILSRKQCPVVDAAAVMEVIMHFTQALNGTVDVPRKSTRIKPLRQTFGRWCAQKMVDKAVVMELIRSLDTPAAGTMGAYTAYHNCIADPEIPWRSMLTCLS